MGIRGGEEEGEGGVSGLSGELGRGGGGRRGEWVEWGGRRGGMSDEREIKQPSKVAAS